MKPNTKSTHKFSYLPVLIFIALLILLSLTITLLSLNKNYENPEIINISGRQRMLSQKLSVMAFQSYTETRSIETSKFIDDINLWRTKHNYLIDKYTAKNVTNFDQANLETLVQITANINYAQDFINSEDLSLESLFAFKKNQDEYLEKMDAFVNYLQYQSEVSIENQILSSIGISIFTLGLLFLLYWFMLRSTEDQLTEQALTLQTKNQQLEHFAFVASHDLQEPLRTVTNYLEIFEEDYEDKLDEEAHRYFKFINDATNRMRKLIQGLLTYSRLGNSDKRSHVDFNSILEEVKQDLEGIIKENNVTIENETLPELLGYRLELKQLFQNLISNSIKFRKVDVPIKINITLEIHRHYYIFRVKDNGIGIPENNLVKIFDMFSKLHSSKVYEGQGIGLAFCKKIVELHGGQIWVTSKLGEGTTIHFSLLRS